MNHVLAILRKEFREFRSDRLSLMLAFMLPLISLLLFGYGIRLEAKNISVVVCAPGADALSRDFVRSVFATGTFVGVRPDESAPGYPNLRNAAKSKAAIVLPVDFGDKIARNQPTAVDVLVDGTDVNAALTIPNVLAGVQSEFIRRHVPVDVHSTYTIPVVTMMFNVAGRESHYVVLGVFGIILWMFPSLLAAVSAARETDQQTIILLYSSGLSAAEYICGKAIFFLGLGLCQAMIMIPLGCLLFSIPLERLFTAILVTPIYILTAVLFGLLVGTRANSQTTAVQTTSTGGFFPTLLLSGFVYPTGNVPFPLDLVSYAVPARYYIELLRNVCIKGLPVYEMSEDALILSVFAVALFLLTWIPLRRMQLKS